MRSWQDPELARDPRCATMRSRAAHAAELVPELRAALALRSALEWEEIFGERVPCAAVSSRRRAIRSFRSAGREAPDPGAGMATAAGGDPREGDQADGAPARRPRTQRSPA